MLKRTNVNCGNCALLKNGRLCREMGILINERDLKGDLKCKYHKMKSENADNQKKYR